MFSAFYNIVFIILFKYAPHYVILKTWIYKKTMFLHFTGVVSMHAQASVHAQTALMLVRAPAQTEHLLVIALGTIAHTPVSTFA